MKNLFMGPKVDFSNFSFDEKLTSFPTGVMEYLPFSKLLDLSRLPDLDMIPAGLEGVKTVQIRHENADDFPHFIAPDFKGEIGYFTADETWENMPADLVKNAQENYVQKREFAESSRHPYGGCAGVCVLPTGMRFIENNGSIYLDLSKTTIAQRPFVFGVSDVIMPCKKINHHRSCQMVYSKPRIKE